MKRLPPRWSSALPVIFFVIGHLTIFYALINRRETVPVISPPLTISRSAVIDSAQVFLKQRGFDLTSFKSSIILTQDETARLFLEKELGVKKSSDLARDSLSIWSWRVTFRKLEENSEYSVQVSPIGKIMGFSRLVSPNLAGPSLSFESARILTEAFLSRQMNFRSEEWELLDSNSSNQTPPRDNILTYQRRGSNYKGALEQLKVTLQGAEIGSFHRFLLLPPDFEQELNRNRSRNDMAQNAAEMLGSVFILAALAVMLRRLRAKQLTWFFPLLIGVVLSAVTLVGDLNMLPWRMDRSGAIDAESSSFFNILLFILLNAVFTGGLGIVFVAAGEALYSELFPHRPQLSSIKTIAFWRNPETYRSIKAGCILALFTIGFSAIFRFWGGNVGLWLPYRTIFDQTASAYCPVLHPLTLGIGTALLEECWFRLLGICWLIKIIHSRTAAVIITAVVWGFLQTGYPQSPDFILGFEGSIIGAAAGGLFLHHGWLAVVVWRFLTATWLNGQFLF